MGLHLIHASNDEQGAGVSRVRVRVGWCTRHCPLVKRKRQGGLTAEQQQGDAVVRCHAEGLGGYAFRFGDAARRRFIGDSSPIHRRLPPHGRPARAPAVLSFCIDVKARHGRHRISSQCSFRPAGVSRHRSWVVALVAAAVLVVGVSPFRWMCVFVLAMLGVTLVSTAAHAGTPSAGPTFQVTDPAMLVHAGGSTEQSDPPVPFP